MLDCLVILGYIVNSRPAWTVWNPVSKSQKKKKAHKEETLYYKQWLPLGSVIRNGAVSNIQAVGDKQRDNGP